MNNEKVSSIIDDFLEISNDISIAESRKKNKISKFFYSHITKPYYLKKVAKTVEELNNIILDKDNLDSVLLHLYNTFGSQDGAFDKVAYSRHYIMSKDQNDEYYINEALIYMDDDKKTKAKIITYSNNNNISIEFRINSNKYSQSNDVNKSITMTYFCTELASKNKVYSELISDLNTTMISILKQYILYCFNE